jgi:hypothetical protein
VPRVEIFVDGKGTPLFSTASTDLEAYEVRRETA